VTGVYRLVCVCAVLALAGCAEPSGSFGDYQSKAHQSAQQMVSAIETGRLAARHFLAGDATQAFTDVIVTGAEKDGDSVQSTFDSRQPPDQRSADLKDQVDQPLQDATSALSDLRIAVRRSDAQDIRKALSDLDDPLQKLQKIAGS
jgi:hypothetical protein